PPLGYPQTVPDQARIALGPLVVEHFGSATHTASNQSPAPSGKANSSDKAVRRCVYCRELLRDSPYHKKSQKLGVPFNCPKLAEDIEKGTVDKTVLKRGRDLGSLNDFLDKRPRLSEHRHWFARFLTLKS